MEVFLRKPSDRIISILRILLLSHALISKNLTDPAISKFIYEKFPLNEKNKSL